MSYAADTETLLKATKGISPLERLLNSPETPKTDNQSDGEVVFRQSAISFPMLGDDIFGFQGSNALEQGSLHTDSYATQLAKILLETNVVSVTVNEPMRVLCILNEWPVSSSLPKYITTSPEEEFRQMTIEAEGEVFEHGMESVFSLSLTGFIETHKERAISIISTLLATGTVDKAVAMETLHQLGQSEHEPTYDARLNLLVQNLESDLAMIRYGAMYGLSSMDDPKDYSRYRDWLMRQEKDPDLLKVS